MPDKHPDEKEHIAATIFYQNNYLPPLAKDINIQNTYSREGYSRLNETSSIFLIMGKMSLLMRNNLSSFKYRFFNFSLLICLFITFFYFYLKDDKRYLFLIPVIIIPQCWYLFTYCNDSAFPLFLSFVSIILSFRNKLTKLNLVFVGLVLGLLFLEKINYTLFAFIPILSISIFKLYKRRNQTINYVYLLFPIILLIFLRVGYDWYLYEGNKSVIISEIAQNIARSDFKDASFPTFKLINKLDNLSVMLYDMRWFKTTFNSFFITLGKMNIYSFKEAYQILNFVALILIGILFHYTLMLEKKQKVFIIIFSSIFIMNIIASIHLSWTFDFQPQGRYLFSSLYVFGLLFYQLKNYLSKSFWSIIKFIAVFNLLLFININISRDEYFINENFNTQILAEPTLFKHSFIKSITKKINSFY